VLLTLKAFALTRIVTKNSHLPATTALGSMGKDYRFEGLRAEANVLMPNFTPLAYKRMYEIYGKRCVSEPTGACGFCMQGLGGGSRTALLTRSRRSSDSGREPTGGGDMFRKIEAIIREEALDAVRTALSDIGIVGMNVFEIRGHGRLGSQEHSWRYTYLHKDMLPKIQLNIILSEHNVERTVEAIMQAARTGKEGDGIIFISPVEDVVRVRTGERGAEALSYPGDIDARRTR
jgi:nitrogen regulatory protein P-II 1